MRHGSRDSTQVWPPRSHRHRRTPRWTRSLRAPAAHARRRLGRRHRCRCRRGTAAPRRRSRPRRSSSWTTTADRRQIKTKMKSRFSTDAEVEAWTKPVREAEAYVPTSTTPTNGCRQQTWQLQTWTKTCDFASEFLLSSSSVVDSPVTIHQHHLTYNNAYSFWYSRVVVTELNFTRLWKKLRLLIYWTLIC